MSRKFSINLSQSKEHASALIDSPLVEVIPPNLDKDKWEIVLTLYFIILFEFNYDKFVELENWEIKKATHIQNVLEKSFDAQQKGNFHQNHNIVERFYPNISVFNLKDIELDRKINLRKLLLLFIPKDCESVIKLNYSFEEIPLMIAQFDSESNKILVRFCSFLYSKITSDSLNSPSSFVIWNYFKLARTMF